MNVYKLYHQVIKNQEKRRNIDDSRLILWNDISKSDQQKRDSFIDVEKLWENSMKIERIFPENKNGQKNNVYLMNMKERISGERNES